MADYVIRLYVYNAPRKGVGRIDIILPDDLENKLRRQVGHTYGARRGALTDAITEAINNWIAEQARKEAKTNR